ncbi:MAG: hypothetical protein WKI04_03655 [Ferruginibacter sp.]
MKKIILISILLFSIDWVNACPVCERNKPEILKGITHGSGPESNWDYLIVGAIAVLALSSLFYAVKWLINPNENNPDHIKYSLFNEQ